MAKGTERRRFGSRNHSARHRRLRTEQLERRMLLAADVITDYQVYDINTEGPPAVSDFFEFNNKLYYQDTTPEAGTELFAFDLNTGTAAMVADINPGAASSHVGSQGNFLAVGSNLYFSAFDVAHGFELRVLDTTDNTVSLIDINPGLASSNAGELTGFFADGDRIYFNAIDDTIGNELRVLDTTDHSVASVDINVGTESSFVGTNGGFALVGDLLYFAAKDTSVGNELRILDTTDNSFVTIDIYTGDRSSDPGEFSGFVATGNQLYFEASDSTASRELRMLDTSDNSVTDLNLRLSFEPEVDLQLFGTELIFTADDDQFGREPRILDTTDNSVTTIDVRPGSSESRSGETRGFSPVGSAVYFVDPNLTLPTERLLKYDTVTAQITELATFVGEGHSDKEPPRNPDNFHVVGDRIYFTGFDLADGNELYVLDTRDDSIEKIDVFPGLDIDGLANSSNAGHFGGFAIADDQVYFAAATSSAEGYGIIKHDFTSDPISDPVRLIDLYSGSESSEPGTRGGYATIGSKVFFASEDSEHGLELRQLDLSDGSTVTFDVWPGQKSSLSQKFSSLIEDTAGFVARGSKLFFVAADPTFGFEVRVLDTTDNSIETIDVSPGPAGSLPGHAGFALVGNRLFFFADDDQGVSGFRELNTNDLTLTTHDLSGPGAGSQVSSGLSEDVSFSGSFFVHQSKIFFPAGNAAVGGELGVFDTTDDSYRIVDINPGPESSEVSRYFSRIAATDNHLFLAARHQSPGRVELQVVDTTTYAVQSVLSPGAGTPSDFVTIGDKLYFAANSRLHVFDPTDSSVTEITEANGRIYEMAALGTDLYFSIGLNLTSNQELMKLDTVTGAVTLFDINFGSDGSDPFELTVINGLLYFVATTADTGMEPMFLDPETGHVAAIDIFSGFESSQIGPSGNGRTFGGFATVGDTLVFEARVPHRGRELVSIPIADGEHCFALGNLFFTNEDVSVSCHLFPTIGAPAAAVESSSPIVIGVAGTLGAASTPSGAANVGVPFATNLGTLTLTSDGQLDFVPGLNEHVADQFAFIVDNGDGSTSEYSVTVEVNQVNDPGVFGGDIHALATSTGFALGTVTFSDPIDGDSNPRFRVVSAKSAAGGNVFIDAGSGSYAFVANPTFTGIDTFTVVVTDDDGNDETQLVSVGVGPITIDSPIADSSQWTPLFRDFVDGGFNDALAEGYRVADGSEVSLPWINIDRIKIPFNVDVEDSLDVDDFLLVGDSGFDADFAGGNVPGITRVDWDQATNSAVLVLDSPLGPNRFVLTVFAEGIESIVGQSMAQDRSYTFYVLPGDSVDRSALTDGYYEVDGMDATFVRNGQAGFLYDGPGSSLLDGPYFNYGLRADLNGDGTVDAVDATAVRDRFVSFVSYSPPTDGELTPLTNSAEGEAELLAESVEASENFVCVPAMKEQIDIGSAVGDPANDSDPALDSIDSENVLQTVGPIASDPIGSDSEQPDQVIADNQRFEFVQTTPKRIAIDDQAFAIAAAPIGPTTSIQDDSDQKDGDDTIQIDAFFTALGVQVR